MNLSTKQIRIDLIFLIAISTGILLRVFGVREWYFSVFHEWWMGFIYAGVQWGGAYLIYVIIMRINKKGSKNDV